MVTGACHMEPYSYNVSRWVSLHIPDLQVQHQETAVSNVLEAPGQVSEGLEDLLSAPLALTERLAVG